MRLGRYRLRHLVRSGHHGARLAEKLLTRPDRLLGIILLGNNSINIAASSIATILALRLGGDRVVAIAMGILTFVILIFAEVAPKTLAALKPEPIAFGSSYVYIVLLKALYPLVWLLNTLANGLLRLFGLRVGKLEEHSLGREELRTLVLESGNLAARRQQLLLGVFELEEATVEDVMLPRGRIEGIDMAAGWEDIEQRLRASRHAYLPLYRESIEDIIGMLHVRELLPVLLSGELDPERLRNTAHEPYFIPEGTTLARQLIHFQRRNLRCGLVVDEYGDILGLLTLADVLSEIAGELGSTVSDRRDEILREANGEILVPGSIGIRTLNRRLGWHLPLEGPRTLNGLVLEQLETIPRPGVRLTLGTHPAEVVEANPNGVLLLRFPPATGRTHPPKEDPRQGIQ